MNPDQVISIGTWAFAGIGAIIVACFKFVDIRTQKAVASAREDLGKKIDELTERVASLERSQDSARNNVLEILKHAVQIKHEPIVELSQSALAHLS